MEIILITELRKPIGNATDLWTAYREHEFPTYGVPWVGYLMLIGDDEKSTMPVRNYTNHYPYCPNLKVHLILSAIRFCVKN